MLDFEGKLKGGAPTICCEGSNKQPLGIRRHSSGTVHRLQIFIGYVCLPSLENSSIVVIFVSDKARRTVWHHGFVRIET